MSARRAAAQLFRIPLLLAYSFRPLLRGRPRPRQLGSQLHHPGGMVENSPAFQRRDNGQPAPSPAGTAEIGCVSRPCGTYPSRTSNPALKRRAIILSPSGTETAPVTSNPSDIGRPRPQPLRIPSARFARDAKLRSTLLMERHFVALKNSFLLIPRSSFPLLKRPHQDFCIPQRLGRCLGDGSGLRHS